MTINETSIWISENTWIWEFIEYILSCSYDIVIQTGSDKCIYLSLLSNKERVVVKSGSMIPEGVYPTDVFVTLSHKHNGGDMDTRLVVFNDKKIRRILIDNQWFFAIVDIIAVLTDSDKPRDYWYRMKKREKESSGLELSTLCRQLKLESSQER